MAMVWQRLGYGKDLLYSKLMLESIKLNKWRDGY